MASSSALTISSTTESESNDKSNTSSNNVLPTRLINMNSYTGDYECGYHENQIISNNIDKLYTCQICKGLPRYPILPPNCPHMLCANCVLLEFQINGKPSIMRIERRKIDCPICREPYTFIDIIPFTKFQPVLQCLIKNIDITCIYKCGYRGHFKDIDDHESYNCKMRPIECPHYFCTYSGPFCDVATHYQTCSKKAIICEKCELLVKEELLGNHDCIKRLKMAILSM